MLSPELVPAIHSSSYDAWRVPGFEPTPGGDPVVEAFAAQASAVSVGIKAMIDRAIDENASLVLDGVSLLPGRLDLDAYAQRAHVVFLIVAAFDGVTGFAVAVVAHQLVWRTRPFGSAMKNPAEGGV